MSTKYVIDRFSNKISAHECVKETSCFAWLKGVYSIEPITKKKKCDVFNTWAEAHAELMRRAEAQLADARRVLQVAQGHVGNVRGMKPPGEQEFRATRDPWHRGPRAYPLTPELCAKIEMEHRCRGARHMLQQFCEQIPCLSRDLSKVPQDEAILTALETALAHVQKAAKVLGEVKP